MSTILAFERCPYTAERIANIFRSAGHLVRLSTPLGTQKTAELVSRVKPVVVTTCWRRSDQYTIIGVRRAASQIPIWIISDVPEEEIAAAVSDAQLIIPKRYPELLREIILRELGMGTDA